MPSCSVCWASAWWPRGAADPPSARSSSRSPPWSRRRRRSASWPWWRCGSAPAAARCRPSLSTAGASAATTVAATALAGTGYGWIGALDTPVAPHNWALTSLLGRATGALLDRLGSGLAPLAVPAWHLLGLAATAVTVLLIWLRLRPRPVYALGLSLLAVAVLGPAIRPWYVLWGLFLIAAAAPSTSVRHRVAALAGVLALAVLPSGGPADLGQLLLAVSGGALGAVVLWQAHQAHQAREAQARQADRSAPAHRIRRPPRAGRTPAPGRLA